MGQTRRPADSPGPGRLQGAAALLILLGTGVAGCGGESGGHPAEDVPLVAEAPLGEPVEPIPDPPEGAPELLAALEELLLREIGVILPFEVEAEGALEVALQGSLWLAPGGRARLNATGTFGGEAVSSLLVSDGRRMIWENNGDRHEGATPPHLREGLVLGLSRMGVLHNLARLVAGSPPDATDGSADGWVRIAGPAHAGSDPSEPTGVAVHFGIVVGGVASGEATLWMDPQTRVPLLRRQEVSFPDGSMQVIERYEDPMADVEVADSLFVIPSVLPAATAPLRPGRGVGSLSPLPEAPGRPDAPGLPSRPEPTGSARPLP